MPTSTPLIPGYLYQRDVPEAGVCIFVAPMIFNDRIIISPVEDWTTSVTAGWCYDRVEASDPIAATLRTMAIAAEWDPEVDREPRAYKKCAFDARKGRQL